MSLKKKIAPVKHSQLYHSTIFTSIYKNNAWGGEKKTYYSGPGSHNEHISGYAEVIAKFIAENNIQSIIEIGCGDFGVSKNVLNNLDKANYNYLYTGYDVVKPLIVQNKLNFGTPQINFKCKNACSGKIITGDLLIVRQVLQHLNNNSILKIVKKFCDYKYILVTEHQPSERYKQAIVPNKDKATDASTRIQYASGVYLDKEPFNCKIESTLYSIPEYAYGFESYINTFLIK